MRDLRGVCVRQTGYGWALVRTAKLLMGQAELPARIPYGIAETSEGFGFYAQLRKILAQICRRRATRE